MLCISKGGLIERIVNVLFLAFVLGGLVLLKEGLQVVREVIGIRLLPIRPWVLRLGRFVHVRQQRLKLVLRPLPSLRLGNQLVHGVLVERILCALVLLITVRGGRNLLGIFSFVWHGSSPRLNAQTIGDRLRCKPAFKALSSGPRSWPDLSPAGGRDR